jgi:hypothetical protein
MRPQPRQEVGVVRVAEERLGVGAHQVGIEVRDDGDLVLAADRRQHGADLRVGEGRVDVGRPLLRGRTEAARRRVLDGHEPRHLCQAPHRLLVHLRRETRCGERR